LSLGSKSNNDIIFHWTKRVDFPRVYDLDYD
jgi:hypothetical protein